MSNTPRETLIAALEKIDHGVHPADQQNILRAIYHGYVEIQEILARNATGRVCVRTYTLRTTDAGRALLEAAQE